MLRLGRWGAAEQMTDLLQDTDQARALNRILQASTLEFLVRKDGCDLGLWVLGIRGSFTVFKALELSGIALCRMQQIFGCVYWLI